MRHVLLSIGILCAMSARVAFAGHVKAQLLADVKQVVPGKPFHLGVLLTLDKDWHTYWLNPGDSGAPTKIKLDLPKGFTAGDVQFPTPKLIIDPGNIKIFGYTDSVMFIAEVTPEASVTSTTPADFTATVSALVCKNVCMPWQASPELKLPIMSESKSPPDNARLFDAWTAQLPLAPKDFSDASFDQQIDPAARSVTFNFWLSADSTNPEIFPGPNDDIDVKVKQIWGRTDAARTGEHFKLIITPLAGHAMPTGELPVVIGWDTSDHHRHGLITKIDLNELTAAEGKQPHG